MEHKFSVLLNISANDKPAWIKQALGSILSNTLLPAEIVIIRNGLVTKDIQEVVDETSKNKTVRILSHQIAYGRAEGFFFALAQCSCDLIALHSAQSISLPERFEKQWSYFNAHPKTAVLGGWYQEMHGDTLLPTLLREVPENKTEINTLLRRKFPFVYRTVMLNKRAVLEAVNGEFFGIEEEEQIWRHLIEKGYKIANLSAVLARVHSSTVYYTKLMRLPCFQMRKELLETMHQVGLINTFTYYRLFCICLIKHLFCSNGLLRILSREAEF